MKINYYDDKDAFSFDFKDFDEKMMFVRFLKKITPTINLNRLIDDVSYYNNKATVCRWSDGSVTKSVCQDVDKFNKETGLAMCIIRKLCNNRNYDSVFRKWAK